MASEREAIAGHEAASRLTAARQRLDVALGRLESAVSRRHADDRASDEVERQIQHLSVDRGMLAEEIDALKRRNRNLMEANAEALERLDAAIAAVSALVDDDPEAE
ncbi:MAG: DUF4164 family protein [Rhodobiaceae bacterium]|nr:DUF4164 family protein [Rhodobiaceae bacterium]